MKEKVSPSQKALNLWAIILILWSLYRANFRMDLPIWFDELIMKPLLFVLPVLWFIRKIEKKPFAQSVNLHFNKALSDIGLGIALGLVFFTVGAISLYIKSGGFLINKVLNSQSVMTFFLALATGFSEELLSRGFILKRLWDESKNTIRAIFISSVLFFFLHIPILLTTSRISGTMLLQVMVTDMVLSIAVSFLFLQRKSLLVAVIVHAFYILSLSIFL